MLPTKYSLHLHITLQLQGPRVHEIHWAAISTAWSRISKGTAPVQKIGAAVSVAVDPPNDIGVFVQHSFGLCVNVPFGSVPFS